MINVEDIHQLLLIDYITCKTPSCGARQYALELTLIIIFVYWTSQFRRIQNKGTLKQIIQLKKWPRTPMSKTLLLRKTSEVPGVDKKINV